MLSGLPCPATVRSFHSSLRGQTRNPDLCLPSQPYDIQAHGSGLEPVFRVSKTRVLPIRRPVNIWYPRMDLNHRPTNYRLAALPLSYGEILDEVGGESNPIKE